MKGYDAPLGSGVGKVPIQDLIKKKKEVSEKIYTLEITMAQSHEDRPELAGELTAKRSELKRVKRAINAVREKESRLKKNRCPGKEYN